MALLVVLRRDELTAAEKAEASFMITPLVLEIVADKH